MVLQDISDLESFVSDATDPIKFQEAYFQVLKPGSGLVKYKSYPYQAVLARDESELQVINKSRQTGISTQTVLDKIHQAVMLGDVYTCVFISLRQDQSNELIFKAKTMIDHMAEPWNIPLIKRQESMIQLPNGARLIAVSAHESAGRSYSADLVLDEFAHVPNDKQILQAAMSITVREGWKVRMLSTPYGDRGEFARIVKGVKAGEITNWSLHEIHWSECPDLSYERIMERCLSDEMYQQEYNLQFLDEATSMIPWQMLMDATDLQMDQWTLENATRSSNPVVLGIDPGTKKDETGFVITELIGSKALIRHVYAEKLSKDALLALVKQWHRKVRFTRIYIDETGMGAPITADLQRLIGSGIVIGVTLSTPNKEKLVYNMIHMFESNQLSIPDNEYLKIQLHALERGRTDILGLSKFTGKVKAKHDDLVWGTALSLCHNMMEAPALQIDVSTMEYGRAPRQRRKYYANR